MTRLAHTLATTCKNCGQRLTAEQEIEDLRKRVRELEDQLHGVALKALEHRNRPVR